MTETFIELTEDEFDDRYPLVPNHINRSAGWAIGDGGGCLFETFGEEFAFIRRQDPCKVWTLVDGEDGDMYVVSGLHFVNRVGYLLSTIPVPEQVFIQVHLPMAHDEDADTTGQAS
jgi:hypothetical protein